MNIKQCVLALTQQAFALALSADGTIAAGSLRPALGRSRFPPDLAPVRAQIASAAGVQVPADLVLVLDASDPDPELTAAAVAEHLARVARVRGVAAVGRSEVLGVLAAVSPGITSDASDDIVVTAVNSLTGGELSADQTAEAWATAQLVAGTSSRCRNSRMLELIAYPPESLPPLQATVLPSGGLEEKVAQTAEPTNRFRAHGTTADRPGPLHGSAARIRPQPPGRGLMTVDEVAELLGRSRMWVYRHVVGKIPSVRPPGSRIAWFKRSDVEELVSAWTVCVSDGHEIVSSLRSAKAHPDAAAAATAIDRWGLRTRGRKKK